ncbi:MAG: beta-glucosidase BglX [Acidobacteriaceae bacterium]|nr:beta-glucosidase BglX [Acidobacteriaceae bacterium]MBV9296491.1 beta-glucosidase BglX [Acidobacteriaceae bacterium]
MLPRPPLCCTLCFLITLPSFAQSLSVDERVTGLLKQMTLEEKIGQLSQLFMFGPPGPVEEAVTQGRVGSLLFVTDPKVINHLQHVAVEKTRLHIPLIFGFDVIHGFRTIFPVPIAMAASWDPDVATRAQSVAASEAGSVGINWAFAPMLDIARDPRWGRIVEGAGEDPYLGSAMAAAQVRGFQGNSIGAPGHILSCMKHFAGYGAAEGGRDYDASYISETQLRNVYLPPFHAAVEAGFGSAMSAYMDLNDVPATGNRWLLRDVLREEWNFKGFVVSDADAVKSLKVHGYAKNLADAAVLALNAGVDMEMAIGKTAFSEGVADAVKAGQVTLDQIEAADRRILEAKIRLGLFEHPYVDEARSQQILNAAEHRTEALGAAERSAVLLRNEGGLLPLQKGAYKKVAVIGPLADSQLDTIGPWAFQQDLPETITVLAGLRRKFGTGVELNYAQGAQISRKFPSFFDDITHFKPQPAWTPETAREEMEKAVALAKKSDLAILVLGEAQNMAGEAASRESLDLSGQQQQLLEAVVATGKPVVLILINGRPLNIIWASQHVPAILEAWYPGTQGGNAVANLVAGDAVPGGKLPISWPRNVGQIPINYAHNTTQAPENQGKRYWDEESTPLYPFGFGLSYSKFVFSNLKLNAAEIHPDQSVEVTADVENTGSVPADEVAQVYIHQQYGSTSRPVRELKGFQRINVQPNEKKTVRFSLGKRELTYWSTAKREWVEEPSTFDVWLGGDSQAALDSTFRVVP